MRSQLWELSVLVVLLNSLSDQTRKKVAGTAGREPDDNFALAVSGRVAPSQWASEPGARQRPRPDAGFVYGGEVSF